MDLYAYTQIVDLQAIADSNGISVPRCRGYRLMKNEERVTTAEIEQMITDQALYEAEKLFRLHPSGLFYEYSESAKARARRYIVIRKNENGFDEPIAVRWDRVHGKRRKAVKRIFRQVRRDVKEQYALFNSYVGREDVLYIHARLGSTSWTDEKTKAALSYNHSVTSFDTRWPSAPPKVRITPVGAAMQLLLSVVAVPGNQLAGVIDAAVLRSADVAADAPEKGVCTGGRVMPVPNVPVLPVCGLAVAQIKVDTVRCNRHVPDPVEKYILIKGFHAKHPCADLHKLLLSKDGIFTGDVLFLGSPAEPSAVTCALLVLPPPGIWHAAYPAGYPSGKAVGRVQLLSAPGVLFLHQIPGFPVDDCLVAVLIIEPGQDAVVSDFPLCDGISHVAFLPAHVAGVELVLDHLRKRSLLKQLAVYCPAALRIQLVADGAQGVALQEEREHLPYDLRLLGDDDVFLQIIVVAVAEDMLVGHADGAILKAFADAPLAVFGNGTALLLRKGREQGDHQFTAFVQCIDAFLFEAYLNAQGAQSANRLKRVDCVAGKA